MKIVAIVLAALITLSYGEDNGRYRPEVNINYGRYSGDARYYNPYGRYNNYYRNNVRYQNKPYQHFLTPYATVEENKSTSPPKVTIPYQPTEKPTTANPLSILAPKSTAQPTILPVYKSNIPEGSARIVSQDSDFDVNNYRFSYLTENGISAGESGAVEAGENGGTRVTGFYEYIGADGLKYRVDYTADENGFHPSGAHLP